MELPASKLQRIVVVVGEPSGDRLGAALASALMQANPTVSIEGIFGKEMIQAGCLQLHSMDALGFMGLIEPILHLPSILRLRKWLINYVLQDPPDLFIGIDIPDFNLSVEKVLRKAGIKTVHYVSPSVWAWRQGRIKTIKKAVDLMLTLFPFEAKFFQDHDQAVKYIGHPAADVIPFVIDKSAAKNALGFMHDDTVVAVMPGSRNSEMKRMVPLYLQTIKLCSAAKPELKFVMPLVQPAYQEFVEFWRQKIAPDVAIRYVIGDSYAAMRAADAALVTSGTATLELMLHKVPMLVAYKTDWLSYSIVKRMIKVRHIALPNLLADADVVAEYIQDRARADLLATGLLVLLDSNELRDKQIAQFNQQHKVLAQDAARTAAKAVLELMG